MSNTKRILGTSMIAAILVLTAGACSGGSSAADFCKLSDDKSLQDANMSNPKEASKAMKKIKDAAPAEIKGDVEFLADAIDKYTEASGNPEKLAKLDIDQEKMEAATHNIEKYTDKHCK